MNLDCTLQEKVIPCLEFSIEFQSNQLIYQKEYTKRQQIIYLLVYVIKFCYKFIFQFVATTLLGFGIYKGDDLKEKKHK